jgi:hypothetical protein
MEIRRPLAALFAALALFGGGATLTACEAAGQDQNDGTTDDSGDQSGGEQSEDSDQSGSDDDDQSNQEPDTEDENDDSQDPD